MTRYVKVAHRYVKRAFCPQCRRHIAYRENSDGTRRFYPHKSPNDYLCPEGRAS